MVLPEFNTRGPIDNAPVFDEMVTLPVTVVFATNIELFEFVANDDDVVGIEIDTFEADVILP